MDYESLKYYEGKLCTLILQNNYRYTATIISVKEKSIVFIDKKERKLIVTPESIILIEERE